MSLVPNEEKWVSCIDLVSLCEDERLWVSDAFVTRVFAANERQLLKPFSFVAGRCAYECVLRNFTEAFTFISSASPDVALQYVSPDSGWTLLHLAVYLGHLRIAALLVEAGASQTAVDKDGLQPFELARPLSRPACLDAAVTTVSFSSRQSSEQPDTFRHAFDDQLPYLGDGAYNTHSNVRDVSNTPDALSEEIDEEDLRGLDSDDDQDTDGGEIAPPGRREPPVSSTPPRLPSSSLFSGRLPRFQVSSQPMNACHSFGNNAMYQLGYVTNHVEQLKPRLIPALATESIIDVQVSTSVSMALSSSGTVFTWGNGTFGRLGHGDGDNSSVIYPRRVLGLDGVHVVAIRCEGAVCAALSASGKLYAWGTLSADDRSISLSNEPTLLEVTRNDEQVTHVAVSVSRIVAVTDHSAIYTLGQRLTDTDVWDKRFRLIPSQDTLTWTIDDVLCSSEALLVQCANGAVYQQLVGTRHLSRVRPAKDNMWAATIDLCETHGALTTKRGQVFIWDIPSKESWRPSTSTSGNPRQVKALAKSFCTRVAVTPSTLYAITNTGRCLVINDILAASCPATPIKTMLCSNIRACSTHAVVVSHLDWFEPEEEKVSPNVIRDESTGLYRVPSLVDLTEKALCKHLSLSTLKDVFDIASRVRSATLLSFCASVLMQNYAYFCRELVSAASSSLWTHALREELERFLGVVTDPLDRYSSISPEEVLQLVADSDLEMARSCELEIAEKRRKAGEMSHGNEFGYAHMSEHTLQSNIRKAKKKIREVEKLQSRSKPLLPHEVEKVESLPDLLQRLGRFEGLLAVRLSEQKEAERAETAEEEKEVVDNVPCCGSSSVDGVRESSGTRKEIVYGVVEGESSNKSKKEKSKKKKNKKTVLFSTSSTPSKPDLSSTPLGLEAQLSTVPASPWSKPTMPPSPSVESFHDITTKEEATAAAASASASTSSAPAVKRGSKGRRSRGSLSALAYTKNTQGSPHTQWLSSPLCPPAKQNKMSLDEIMREEERESSHSKKGCSPSIPKRQHPRPALQPSPSLSPGSKVSLSEFIKLSSSPSPSQTWSTPPASSVPFMSLVEIQSEECQRLPPSAAFSKPSIGSSPSMSAWGLANKDFVPLTSIQSLQLIEDEISPAMPTSSPPIARSLSDSFPRSENSRRNNRPRNGTQQRGQVHKKKSTSVSGSTNATKDSGEASPQPRSTKRAPKHTSNGAGRRGRPNKPKGTTVAEGSGETSSSGNNSNNNSNNNRRRRRSDTGKRPVNTSKAVDGSETGAGKKSGGNKNSNRRSGKTRPSSSNNSGGDDRAGNEEAKSGSDAKPGRRRRGNGPRRPNNRGGAATGSVSQERQTTHVVPPTAQMKLMATP